jgi:uncharacterized protein (TIGR03085 family)
VVPGAVRARQVARGPDRRACDTILLVTRLTQVERNALCDTLLAVGPDAPTLSHPWRSRELAAHLVLRETRPDLSIGQYVPPLRGRLDRALQERAATPYADLVETLREGPPWWSLISVPAVDDATNLIEFFVHHEDVLRAGAGWTARELDAGYEAALWERLKRASRLYYRRADVGVVLDAGDDGEFEARPPGAGGTVVITGQVAELLLYSQGRRSAARVALAGPDDAIARLAATDLSI